MEIGIFAIDPRLLRFVSPRRDGPLVSDKFSLGAVRASFAFTEAIFFLDLGEGFIIVTCFGQYLYGAGSRRDISTKLILNRFI